MRPGNEPRSLWWEASMLTAQPPWPLEPVNVCRYSDSSRSHDGLVVKLLASHLGEPGTIPGRVAPGYSHVGVMLVGGLSQRSPVITAPSLLQCSILILLNPIGSQDLDNGVEEPLGTNNDPHNAGPEMNLRSPESETTKILRVEITRHLMEVSAQLLANNSYSFKTEALRHHLRTTASWVPASVLWLLDNVRLREDVPTKVKARKFVKFAVLRWICCCVRHFLLQYVVYEAAVTEWLACLPPTKTNRIQLPWAGHLIFACGNRSGRCRWSAVFFRYFAFPPPHHSRAASDSPQSSLSALKTSLLGADKISSH
ncbi:hypothetical protein PR048_006347, partial [Dryococelus australis]